MDRPSLADLIVTSVRDPPTNKLRPVTSSVESNNASPDRINARMPQFVILMPDEH